MIYYSNDSYIGRSLDLYGEYSERETELFRQVILPGMVIVDVGANIGAHTLFFSRAVGGSGRVYAFEPQRALFYILCGNLALNGLPNVTALQAALGAQAGTISVPSIDYTKGGNFGGVALGDYTTGEQAEIHTLDSLRLQKCHFVKIDVEGMERAVLEGATETLARCKPILYVENDRASNSVELIRWLFDHAFRLFWHTPSLFNPKNHFGNPQNVFGNIVSVNMLCVSTSITMKIEGLREIKSPDDTWQ